MNRDLEYKFFIEFQDGGTAILVLKMALYKYCGIGSEVPTRPDYPDGIIDEIKERTEGLDTWPWRGSQNVCPLFDEIGDNLDVCNSADIKINYVIGILKQFQYWVSLYSLRPEKLKAIGNSVMKNSLEMFFLRWEMAYQSFAQNLAVVLAERGINLLEIQERCDIKIIDSLDPDELWIDFGTRKIADYYLSKLKHTTDRKDLITEKDGSINTEATWNEYQVEDKLKIAKIGGRPPKTVPPLLTKMIGDKQERQNTLEKLHKLIDGKKGKAVALAIYGCEKAYKMQHPTFTQLKKEFCDIGNESGYDRYYREAEYRFTKDEIADTIAFFQ